MAKEKNICGDAGVTVEHFQHIITLYVCTERTLVDILITLGSGLPESTKGNNVETVCNVETDHAQRLMKQQQNFQLEVNRKMHERHS